MQKIAEDVDRAGLRGCLEAPRFPRRERQSFASHWGRNRFGWQTAHLRDACCASSRGDRWSQVLKVSAAPLSTVNLTLWKDFFVVFFSFVFKSGPSLVSTVEGNVFRIASWAKEAIRSTQVTPFNIIYCCCHCVIYLVTVSSWPVTQTRAVTHFGTPPCPDYMNHKLIIAPFICVQLLQCIVTVLYGDNAAHTVLEPGRRQERLD